MNGIDFTIITVDELGGCWKDPFLCSVLRTSSSWNPKGYVTMPGRKGRRKAQATANISTRVMDTGSH